MRAYGVVVLALSVIGCTATILELQRLAGAQSELASIVESLGEDESSLDAAARQLRLLADDTADPDELALVADATMRATRPGVLTNAL